MKTYALSLLPERFAVCRLDAAEPLPEWAEHGSLLSISRTRDELSIVCEDRHVPPGVMAERGWHGLRVAGPLGFGEVGVMAALAGALAQAGISLFAISTYDTDYLLVRDLEAAVRALRGSGHHVS